jgi:hypothetical protein
MAVRTHALLLAAAILFAAGPASALPPYLDGETTIDDELGLGRGMVAGDFNNDGRLDYAAAGFQTQVAVFLDTGEGFEQVIISEGAAARDVELGDFDHDGDLDLAVASASDPRGIVVYLNQDDGTSWTTLPRCGGLTHSIDVADIDGDGDLDVAGGAAGELQVCYWDDGELISAAIPTWGADDLEVALADIDGDGDLEILTSDTSGEVDRILWANDTGDGWEDHTIVEGVTASPIPADVDGDGDTDFFTVSTGDADFRGWFENVDGGRPGRSTRLTPPTAAASWPTWIKMATSTSSCTPTVSTSRCSTMERAWPSRPWPPISTTGRVDSLWPTQMGTAIWT